MPLSLKAVFKQVFSGSKNLIRVELIFAMLFSEFFANLFHQLSDIIFSIPSIHFFSLGIVLLFILSFLSDFVRYHLRLISNLVYVFAILFVVYAAYLNEFNKDSFFAFVLVFGFFNFMLSSTRIYLLLNVLVLTALFVFLVDIEFKTVVPIKHILGTIFIIGAAGYSLTSARKYYQNKIKERENMLNHIFDRSYLGLLLIDRKKNTVWDINDRVLAIFNLDEKEDIRGIPIEEFELNGEEIFKGKVEQNTFTHELRDHRIWRVNQQNISYGKKDFNLISIDEFENALQFKEASDFKKLQDFSDSSYRYLFEENVSLMCILNEDNKIIDVNQSLCKLLGRTKEELIGSHTQEITFKEVDDREELNQRARAGEEVHFEKTVFKKSGEKIELEIILRTGKYFGKEVLISNARDITKRIELEEEAKISYERYYNVTNQSAIGFVISDLEGNILETNNSFLNFIGFSVEELSEIDVSDLSHAEDLKLSKSISEQLIRGEIEVGEMEKRYYHKDGSLLFGLLKIILQKNSRGEAIYFFSQIVDITAIRNAQAELETSEKSYKDLFNNSDDLLYILNRENQFIDINDAVAEHYGYKKEEVLGKTPDLFSAPGQNELDTILMDMDKVWEGKDLNMLWWSVKKSGEIFPKDLSVRKGNYLGNEALIAKGKDISESYNFERQLKEKEKRYRDLFERNLAGVYRTSLAGEILECNPAFLNILGYEEKDPEAAGINANDFHLSSENRTNFLNKLKNQDHLKGEKLILKKRSGELITVLVNVSVINDDEGNFMFFEGSIIDISPLEQTQKKLQNSEKKFKELINSSSFGVIILQEEQVLFANSKAAMILGYSDQSEITVKRLFEVLLEEDRSMYEKHMQELQCKKQVPFTNFTMQMKSGKLVDIELKPSLIEYEGEPCVQISFIDISDKIKFQAASDKIKATEKFNSILQKQLREKEVLLQEVHHRVKNNMQVISSILSLQGTYHPDKQVNRILKESQNRILSMALIHEKLYTTKDFSKISFNSYLEDLVRNIVGSNKPKLLDLNLVFDLDKVFLSLDHAIPLGLVINELISNSLKYAYHQKETGHLFVELKEENKSITLVIKDDGLGLPEGIDFKETETLGLQLVGTLVGQLNGEISLNNDEGACFTINFNRFE